MSTVGRPKEHDDQTRAALLVAAERLLAAQGAAGLSVRAVADEVGTSTRAVYSVFGSKAALLEALASRLFELLSDTIDALPVTDDPVADIVTASTRGFRKIARQHSTLYSLVFLRVVPELSLGSEFNATASQTFARLERLVARLPALEGADAAAIERAARAVHALTEGLATMELRGALGGARDADRAWRAALIALLSGLSAHGAQ